jgi:peptide-N4-(N-acetyl-beta-glucosaminyl)asparagine amidase
LLADEALVSLPSGETFAVLDDHNMYLSLSHSTTSVAQRPAAGLLALADGMMESCTRIYGASPIEQPRFLYSDRGKDISVCGACAVMCKSDSSGAVSCPLAPATAAGGALALRTRFTCDCASAGSGCLFAPRYDAERSVLSTPAGQAVLAELAAAAARQAGSQGMAQLQALAATGAHGDAGGMLGRITAMCHAVRRYEDQALLARARAVIPVAKLVQRAQDNRDADKRPTFDDELLRQLAIWFKTEFFKWTNSPPCTSCGGGTDGIGGVAPNAEERAGLAGVTELHRCGACGTVVRFPRYNEPGKLLEWRQGRCGEWANAFTLCCLAMGFQARHATNWEDHVWTEVWSPAQGKWLHVDSCECAVDAPMLYEAGWGKKMSYVISVGVDEVVDTSRRYTKRWADMRARRGQVSEPWLQAALSVFNALQRQRSYGGVGPCPARAELLVHRQATEERQLQAHVSYDDGARREEELSGRISGSLQWRAQRHELGDGTAASAPAPAAAAVGIAASHVLLSASDTPANAWLAESGVVVGGWHLSQVDGCPPPASASHAGASDANGSSGASVVVAGASGAAPAAAPGLTVHSLRGLTSFGKQLLALSTDGSMWWKAAPAYTFAPAAVGGQGGWKQVHVVSAPMPDVGAADESAPAHASLRGAASPRASASGATGPSLLQAWPPVGQGYRIEALAAEHRRLSFFAVVSCPVAPGAIAATAHCAGVTASRLSSQPRAASVWHVCYMEGLAVATTTCGGASDLSSPVSKKGWLAKLCAEVRPLPFAPSSDCSATVSGGCLWLLVDQSLWAVPTSSLAPSGASGSASVAPESPATEWRMAAPAPGCSHLTGLPGRNAVLLALRDADKPTGAAAPALDASSAGGGQAGEVVVLMSTGTAAVDDATTSGVAAVPPIQPTVAVPLRESSGTTAPLGLHAQVPAWFLSPAPARAAGVGGCCEIVLKLSDAASAGAAHAGAGATAANFAGATSSSSTGAGSAASAALSPGPAFAFDDSDWVCLVGLGQAAEPAWAQAADVWEAAAFAPDVAETSSAIVGGPLSSQQADSVWRPRVFKADGRAILDRCASVAVPCTGPPRHPLPESDTREPVASGDDAASSMCRRFLLQLPTKPGAYEVRYYRGAGFGRCLGMTAGPVLVVLPEDTPAVPASAATTASVPAAAVAAVGAGLFRSCWVPLAPASNVLGLAVAGAAAESPTDPFCVTALTQSGELWTVRTPCYVAHCSLKAQSASGGLCAAIAWPACAGSGEASAPAAGGAAKGAMPQTQSGTDTSKGLLPGLPLPVPSVRGGAGVAAYAAAFTALTPQQRLQALFLQLTRGCSLPAGTCSHPFCACNPDVGAQAPKAAVLAAAKLVAGSDGGSAALCPHFTPPAPPVSQPDGCRS